MKNSLLKILMAFVVLVLVLGTLFYLNRSQSTLPSQNTPNPTDAQKPQVAKDVNTTGLKLTLPAGFSIETYAKNLPGARVLAQDSLGNLWVSRTTKGIVSTLEIKDGKVVSQRDVFKGLKNPHGLAFDPQNGTMLYIAEEDKISRVTTYSDDSLHKILDLPNSGGGHYTRTIQFGPDNRLYVSIGSSCNVCREPDSRRAAIYSMNKDGSDFQLYATGLRNSVFFAWSNIDKSMWATENGRDNLGDNLPPDEINLIKQNGVYGWPNCYGNNIHDDNFDKNTYIRNPCMELFETPAKIELPAHSAPLGLAFVPQDGWPREYWNDLIVAYHGSWNRTVPTGYKLVHIKLDDKGNYQGTEDFLTGFISGSFISGRPVDVVIQPDGTMYVTDDKAGVIYRIYRTNPI